MRHSWDINVLEDRLERSSVQLVLLCMDGASSCDFSRDVAEIDFVAETSFRVCDGSPSVEVVWSNRVELDCFHCFSGLWVVIMGEALVSLAYGMRFGKGA